MIFEISRKSRQIEKYIYRLQASTNIHRKDRGTIMFFFQIFLFHLNFYSELKLDKDMRSIEIRNFSF